MALDVEGETEHLGKHVAGVDRADVSDDESALETVTRSEFAISPIRTKLLKVHAARDDRDVVFTDPPGVEPFAGLTVSQDRLGFLREHHHVVGAFEQEPLAPFAQAIEETVRSKQAQLDPLLRPEPSHVEDDTNRQDRFHAGGDEPRDVAPRVQYARPPLAGDTRRLGHTFKEIPTRPKDPWTAVIHERKPSDAVCREACLDLETFTPVQIVDSFLERHHSESDAASRHRHEIAFDLRTPQGLHEPVVSDVEGVESQTILLFFL